MADFGQLANGTEQLMTTIDPTTLQRQNTMHTQAIATNTKLVTQYRKKNNHQKSDLVIRTASWMSWMLRPPIKPTLLPNYSTKFGTSKQRSSEQGPWNHASSSSNLSRRTTCPKPCLPMWIRLVRPKNQRPRSTRHNKAQLRQTVPPNAEKQGTRT